MRRRKRRISWRMGIDLRPQQKQPHFCQVIQTEDGDRFEA
jgi:hypothetical protein